LKSTIDLSKLFFKTDTGKLSTVQKVVSEVTSSGVFGKFKTSNLFTSKGNSRNEDEFA
jgi:hypothetical protein